MNKYLAVVIGMSISLNTFANSYVFGGRAHFNGALVNPSCAFIPNNNLKHLTTIDLASFLELNVSNCSSTVYYNLAIELRDPRNIASSSNSQSVSEKSFYLLPGANLHHSQVDEGVSSQVALDVNGNQRVVELANIDETVALPLPFEVSQVSQNSTNILISVFYP
ncbi:hypothetical protein [Acinetobacter nematophilus]|uniref:Fimbrial protein n=1 Tax=Acinetobacter nematophilus TaxID=2994642 RepID=A0A9X3DPZ6_9GAMM|nr:hypothetical protein [Acinetobacter nematophilus]MCX5466354.1 hypothetical protein [Acinetobacter nematophilus]